MFIKTIGWKQPIIQTKCKIPTKTKSWIDDKIFDASFCIFSNINISEYNIKYKLIKEITKINNQN